MKLTGMLATLPAIKGIAATSEKPAPSGKQLYEWRIYTLEEDADGLDGFFRDTLTLPITGRISKQALSSLIRKRKKNGVYCCSFIPTSRLTTG